MIKFQWIKTVFCKHKWREPFVLNEEIISSNCIRITELNSCEKCNKLFKNTMIEPIIKIDKDKQEIHIRRIDKDKQEIHIRRFL